MRFVVLFLLTGPYLIGLAVFTMFYQAVCLTYFFAKQMPLPGRVSIPLAAAIVLFFYAFA